MAAIVFTRRTTILPWASKPISASVTWSRPWASVRNASRRLEVHRTGRLICLVAHEQIVSSL